MTPNQGAPLGDKERTILVVDDDPAILAVLKQLLDQRFARMMVYTADSAEGAWEIMATRYVDIVVSDYQMPGTTGLDLLRELKELRPDVICIMITAFAQLDLAIEAINQAHVDHFLTKPLEREEFLQTIEDSVVQKKREEFRKAAALEAEKAGSFWMKR